VRQLERHARAGRRWVEPLRSHAPRLLERGNGGMLIFVEGRERGHR
jgi:hypothetical protein